MMLQPLVIESQHNHKWLTYYPKSRRAHVGRRIALVQDIFASHLHFGPQIFAKPVSKSRSNLTGLLRDRPKLLGEVKSASDQMQ